LLSCKGTETAVVVHVARMPISGLRERILCASDCEVLRYFLKSSKDDVLVQSSHRLALSRISDLVWLIVRG
jgi:hypothetical protein